MQFTSLSSRLEAVLIVIAAVAFISPAGALAASTPSLGSAASYAILSSTYTNTSATTVTGDVGFTTGPAVAPLGTHTNYGSGAPYATAGIDQGNALSSLNSEACTFTFPSGAVNLSTDTTHGTAGVYAPGVYCASGAMDVGGPLSLSGNGTFIFRSTGALTTTAGSVVTLSSGASSCDVFWTPSAAATLAANTTFVGTVISNAGVTVGANTTWTGRSLAFGGTVTTDTSNFSVPTCNVPPPPPAAPFCTLSVNPTTVQAGSSATLSWTTTNANGFSINQGIGGISAIVSGSQSITPSVTTTYTGTATSIGAGSASCAATVTVAATSSPVINVPSTPITPPAVVTPSPTVTPPVINSTPGFPNTGLPPASTITHWIMLSFLGVSILLLALLGRRPTRA